MSNTSKRKKKKESSAVEEYDGLNQPGTSKRQATVETMVTSKSGSNVTSEETLLEKKSSAVEPRTCILEGKIDTMFGHYWSSFAEQVETESRKVPWQSETLSSTICLSQPISTYDDILLQAEEFSSFLEEEGTKVFSSLFQELGDESHEVTSSAIVASSTEQLTMPSVGQKDKEPQDISVESNLSSLHKEKYTLHQQLRSEKTADQFPLSTCKDIFSTEKASQLSERPYTRFKAGQLKTEAKKKHSEEITPHPLQCANCDFVFGQSEKVLGKLMFKYQEKYFSCLACSMNIKEESNILEHIIYHFWNKEIFCMECQKEIYGKVLYKLEKVGTSHGHSNGKEITHASTLPKLPLHEVAQFVAESKCCAHCGEEFCNASENIHKLYENVSPEKCTEIERLPVFCCILCGICSLSKHLIESDITEHFQSKMVRCMNCYSNFPVIHIFENQAVKDVVLLTGNRFVEFDRHIKINCSKCDRYIAESAILEPMVLPRFEKIIDNSLLKIKKNIIYKCVVCYDAFPYAEIGNHILEHIKANHIFCDICQENYLHGYVSIHTHNFTYKEIPTKIFCNEGKHSIGSKEILPIWNVFIIRRSTEEKDANMVYVYYCTICENVFWNKKQAIKHIIVHISNEDITCSLCKNQNRK